MAFSRGSSQPRDRTQVPSFSDAQGVDFLCLEKLYQFDFTAVKSSNGLSRLFLFLKTYHIKIKELI